MPIGQLAHNFQDLTGLRFGKRIILSREPNSKTGCARWRVLCDCGKESVVTTGFLKKSKSCGCDPVAAQKSAQTRKGTRRGQHRLVDPASYNATRHLVSTFNRTLEWRNEQIAAQSNKCAICEKEFVYTPHVDHDHSCCAGKTSCGKCIRALLCHNCNTAIGNLKDSPELLRKAATYIEEWRIKHSNA
jgi:hypothetical protein